MERQAFILPLKHKVDDDVFAALRSRQSALSLHLEAIRDLKQVRTSPVMEQTGNLAGSARR